jgi:ferric-dicitrate binding protein FerR (iron transport regulator)
VSLLQRAEAEEQLSEPMKALWESLISNPVEYDVDWNKMYNSIVESQEHADMVIKRSTSRSRSIYFAAAILILIAGSSLIWFLYSTSSSVLPPATQVVTAPQIKPQATHQTIHLPDGSTVILNSGSTLNYPSAFSKGRRDVYLTGEGFFDIRHDPSNPFFVHAGKLVVKVLGTVFNIRSYPQQENIQVTVTRGKVQVLRNEKTLGILTASQQITFLNSSEHVKLTSADTLAVTAWKPAELHFNDITMEEAARKIEKRFDMTVEFSNPAIKECRVTATFSENDIAEEVLAVICAVSKAEYSIINKKIVINGKGCN